MLAGVCKEPDNTIASAFTLQNHHETYCNVSPKHTEGLQKTLIDHAALYNAHRLFPPVNPPGCPLQFLLLSPLPRTNSLPEDSKIFNKLS